MAFKDFNQQIGDEPNTQQSRLNAAGLINSTIETLWMSCYTSMANGNLVLWNRKLDALWNILGGDCKDGDESDNKMAEINLSIYKTGSLNHKKTGFDKSDDKG